MEHLLGIRGLGRDTFEQILTNAQHFVEVSERSRKKVPPLRGKTVINLFLEPSTRTRTSFEIAGKRLSADVINVSGSGSAVSKGESLRDTACTIQAMHPDIIAIRHASSGAAHFIARHVQGAAVINAGDGMHEHPTQALLDCLSLRQHFLFEGRSLEGLRVAIVGDVLHSRVARSNIWAHKLLGNQVRLVGPPTLIPYRYAEQAFGSDVQVSHDLRTGLAGVDVVMCLRMQLERMGLFFVPNLQEYTREFCVTEKLLAELAPNCVVLHPGPINRGVELATEVADGSRSLMSKQVTNGVAVRMALLFMLALRESDKLIGSEASNSEMET